MNSSPRNPTPFQYGWWSFDLGKYRPCDGTYCFFEYDSLPPIPEAQFTGKLDWLGPLEQDIDTVMQAYRNAAGTAQGVKPGLQKIVTSAHALGLTLPEAYVRLMSSLDLQDRIPSCTACEFRVAKEIVPCPASQNGYIIPFLNDQQDVLLWYLYLTPKGEECVLVSPYALEEIKLAGMDAERAEKWRQAILNNTRVCAPSLEAFVYRFWLENVLWFNANEGEGSLTEDQQRYLAHYSPDNKER
jgi:hypothetical protein